MQGSNGRTLLFAASLFVALTGLHLLLLRLLSPGRSLRVSLSVLLLLAAAAGWFMDTYGVALDKEMLRNTFQTNFTEARDFISWSLAWRLLWQAGPPIALVWMVWLPYSTWLESLRDYALGIAAGAALVCIAVLPMYASHVSFFRNQHAARHLIAPANILLGSAEMLQKSVRPRDPVRAGGARCAPHESRCGQAAADPGGRGRDRARGQFLAGWLRAPDQSTAAAARRVLLQQCIQLRHVDRGLTAVHVL